MILDFEFQERRRGKTTYLINKLMEISTKDSTKDITKENSSIFVVTNTHIASSFKKTLKCNCTFLLPTSLMSNLLGRRDIKQIFMDEVVPTIELLEYCELNDIDIYFRGSFPNKLSKEQREYLLEFYPEVMI